MTINETRAKYAAEIKYIIDGNTRLSYRDLNTLLSDKNPGETYFQQKQWKLECTKQLKERPASQ